MKEKAIIKLPNLTNSTISTTDLNRYFDPSAM